ncbi:MAG: GGDEF domain-containing protein [Sulfurimonadaceae bacterium]
MKLHNFLYSGFEFREDEDLLKFKFRMLNATLAIVAFFTALFGLLSDLGINDIGPIHSKVDYVYSLLTVMLILFLRSSKNNYRLTANLLLFISLLSFTSALLFVPQDEFRMIWFFLLVFVAYILNGSVSGVFFTIASIAVIITAQIFSDLQLSQTAINSGVLGLIIGSLLAHIYTNKVDDYEKSLQESNTALKVLASTDGLTGIMNKRIFKQVSERYFESAQRDHMSLTLLMLDLDHFKKVNDTYGHQLGDMLLIRFVEVAQTLLRKSDILARVGGEEFAVLLFKTDSEGAFTLAEKIRSEVQNIAIEYDGQEVSVTTSIGVSQNAETDKSFDDIFARADKALYQAKAQGRNQTCLE